MTVPSPGTATLENVGLVTHVWESKHILLVSPGTKGQGERITFIEHLLCANRPCSKHSSCIKPFNLYSIRHFRFILILQIMKQVPREKNHLSKPPWLAQDETYLDRVFDRDSCAAPSPVHLPFICREEQKVQRCEKEKDCFPPLLFGTLFSLSLFTCSLNSCGLQFPLL